MICLPFPVQTQSAPKTFLISATKKKKKNAIERFWAPGNEKHTPKPRNFDKNEGSFFWCGNTKNKTTIATREGRYASPSFPRLWTLVKFLALFQASSAEITLYSHVVVVVSFILFFKKSEFEKRNNWFVASLLERNVPLQVDEKRATPTPSGTQRRSS